jgi:predicted phage replisome organizer
VAEIKKYYWLKLKKDFFKRHDIKIIESMPNGKDYLLFYLKLLVESVDHNGSLRFNETIPYDEKMLSVVANTNIDIVRSALKLFTDLKMIEILEDRTIFMTEVERMMGTETYWAEQKRLQRSKEIKQIGQCPENVQSMSNMSNQEIEKEKEKEIDIELDKDKEKENKYSSSQMLLAERLRDLILSNNPNANTPKKMDSWANIIRLMVERDNRAEETIRQVIEWCQKDTFWMSNILSASKLRKQFDALFMQMNRRKANQPESRLDMINRLAGD